MGKFFAKNTEKASNSPAWMTGWKCATDYTENGYCFEGCKKSHKKKNAPEQARWKIFLKELLDKWKVKNNNRDFTCNGRS